MTALSTVGHSHHPMDAFVRMVRTHRIARIVDVRAFPRSRRHPHFNRTTLADALRAAGIAYTWSGDVLGGFRKARPESPHTALADAGLRGFADYMATNAFAQALGRLVTLADESPVAVMCAEADFRHCHRQFIADALSLAGVDVSHLHASRPPEPHALSAMLGDDRDPPVYNKEALNKSGSSSSCSKFTKSRRESHVIAGYCEDSQRRVREFRARDAES